VASRSIRRAALKRSLIYTCGSAPMFRNTASSMIRFGSRHALRVVLYTAPPRHAEHVQCRHSQRVTVNVVPARRSMVGSPTGPFVPGDQNSRG
jgi:hypothetical protein